MAQDLAKKVALLLEDVKEAQKEAFRKARQVEATDKGDSRDSNATNVDSRKRKRSDSSEEEEELPSTPPKKSKSSESSSDSAEEDMELDFDAPADADATRLSWSGFAEQVLAGEEEESDDDEPYVHGADRPSARVTKADLGPCQDDLVQYELLEAELTYLLADQVMPLELVAGTAEIESEEEEEADDSSVEGEEREAYFEGLTETAEEPEINCEEDEEEIPEDDDNYDEGKEEEPDGENKDPEEDDQDPTTTNMAQPTEDPSQGPSQAPSAQQSGGIFSLIRSLFWW